MLRSKLGKSVEALSHFSPGSCTAAHCSEAMKRSPSGSSHPEQAQLPETDHGSFRVDVRPSVAHSSSGLVGSPTAGTAELQKKERGVNSGRPHLLK